MRRMAAYEWGGGFGQTGAALCPPGFQYRVPGSVPRGIAYKVRSLLDQHGRSCVKRDANAYYAMAVDRREFRRPTPRHALRGAFGTVVVPNGGGASVVEGNNGNGVTPPPACQDKAKLRQMLTAAGHAPPAPTGDEQADDLGLALMLIDFAVAQGFTEEEIKSESPEVAARICDALVKASGGVTNGANGNGWWSQQSQGTKIAIGVGGAAVVGLAIYLVIK